MPKKRQLLNNPFLATLTGILLNCYGELVRRTSRIRIQADPEVDRLLYEANAPIIYAIWHCHVFFLPLVRLYARKPISVLLSSHRDAQIVGVAARMRGLELVEGSSTRGGTRAYRQLLALLRGGDSVCITPDGPKGPALKLKAGIVQLAQKSGCAVVPVAAACTRMRRIKTWDRTLLPLPFGRCVLELGPPIYLSAESPLDDQLGQLATALNDTVHRASGNLLASA